jgi:tetratricopeptide (TPR) repeat protein
VTGASAVAARPASRAWSWLAAAALAVVAVIATDAWRTSTDDVAPATPLDPDSLRPGFGPATYTQALADADRAVDSARRMLGLHADEWLRMEVLARALFARHRLTASPTDLAEADRLLDRALATVPWPAGPALTRAQVSLAEHDLAGAERALARFDAWAVPGSAGEQANAHSIRCEIAFERGDLTQARELCAASDDLGLELRRANLLAKTGETAEAVRIVETQLRTARLSPQALATVALTRASVALAQGDWRGSGQWAHAAERVFPGYWLSEAHLAQQAALDGDRAGARTRYAVLATRTGNPDVLDALARLATADGRTAEAREWAAKAAVAWDDRARLLPEAYATHHAEHLLLYGDQRLALAMAEADYRLRPYAGTIVHYAYALWRNGEAARALEVVSKGEARGFLTAEMKLVEAIALGSLGRAAEAGEALAEARRLNPHIDSERQQFVAFGRD